MTESARARSVRCGRYRVVRGNTLAGWGAQRAAGGHAYDWGGSGALGELREAALWRQHARRSGASELLVGAKAYDW